MDNDLSKKMERDEFKADWTRILHGLIPEMPEEEVQRRVEWLARRKCDNDTTCEALSEFRI